MTAGDTFLEVVVPVLGGIVGVIMFASPLKAVLRARREKTLGVRQCAARRQPPPARPHPPHTPAAARAAAVLAATAKLLHSQLLISATVRWSVLTCRTSTRCPFRPSWCAGGVSEQQRGAGGCLSCDTGWGASRFGPTALTGPTALCPLLTGQLRGVDWVRLGD